MEQHRFHLRRFEEGAAEGDGIPPQAGSHAGGGGNSAASYSYEQAEEIASARAERASNSALKSYFTQQGMSEEEVQQALADFRAKREASRPDIATIQRERDDALQQLAEWKHKAALQAAGVHRRYEDFVAYEVGKRVDDTTDFAAALAQYKRDNPQYFGGGYRVGVTRQGMTAPTLATGNHVANEQIRKAARK